MIDLLVTAATAVTIACSTLVPDALLLDLNPTKYSRPSIINLHTGNVYKRWDLNRDGKADVMTSHPINPAKLPVYRQLAQKGVKVNAVEISTRPQFYWVNITGHNEWDRIYIDKQSNGRCTLYAAQDEFA